MSLTPPDAPPPQPRRRRRASLVLLTALVPAALTAYLAPAIPALVRYGALPATPDETRTYLVAGVTPKYVESAPVWPYPKAPEDFTGLTDTIMLVQLRAGERAVKVLNVPRDTWTNIPGWGYSKINAANRHIGPEGLVDSVEQLTGIHVDGYALLSLAALRDVTDAAGGVTVNIEQRMQYTDRAGQLFIDFQPGRQHLSGAQAEAYLRFRHDNLGDIGRVKRQQGFLRQLAARLTSLPGALYAPRVVGALEDNTRTNLQRADVAQLLGALLRRPAVETTLLPGDFGPGGTWQPDRAAIRELASGPFAEEATPGDPRGLRVAVINVNAPDGSAGRLKARLEALGYRHVVTGNGEGEGATTAVLSGDQRAAKRLRDDLGYGSVTADGPGAAGADITVRLGADTPRP